MGEERKEWIFKRGDILYFRPTGMAQCTDIKDQIISLCPWNANQDLGSGKGAIHSLELKDLPQIKFIERPCTFEDTTAKLINDGKY